jgi:outer membrane protein OmpA-like peptidoglycan-associated protein
MRIVPTLTLALVLAAPALAQNDSVTVNGGGAGQTLIDPATGQSRYVPPLLQPWQDEAIRLRPPGHHRPKKPAASTATAITPPPAPVATTPRRQRAATVTPPPARPAPSRPAPTTTSGFPDIDLITGAGRQAQAAPPAPKPAAAPKPPARTASIAPPRSRPATGTRKDSISFAPNASDPSGSAVAAVRTLASSLSGSLGDAGRIQLMAYAGAKGEKTSDTRRLSLKRALVVRQLLIDDGIPSERIDVFALGGADDDGALDRVDVFLKS